MSVEPHPLAQMSCGELETACQRETRNFRHGRPSDPRFCLAIFHRALGGPEAGLPGPRLYDEDARTALVRIYTEYIKAHINPAAVRDSSVEDLVQQVWLRFWRSAQRGILFTSLEAALSYLKQTTVSTLIEEQRQWRKRQREASLQQLIDDSGDQAMLDSSADLFGQHVQQRFRDRCRELLRDPLAYRVFWMRYGLGQPPREIARILAGEGAELRGRAPTSRAVSDLLEQSFRVLRQDAEIQDLLRED
jgi:DNA-directed RNA polymerase specialized sigma24 family protein